MEIRIRSRGNGWDGLPKATLMGARRASVSESNAETQRIFHSDEGDRRNASGSLLEFMSSRFINQFSEFLFVQHIDTEFPSFIQFGTGFLPRQ